MLRENIKKPLALKTLSDAKTMWILAGFLFAAAQMIALVAVLLPIWKGGVSPKFHTLALPLLVFTPWLSGRQLLKKYSEISEGNTSSEINADFSYQIAFTVSTAYMLLLLAIAAFS
jgi:hypothetical protein